MLEPPNPIWAAPFIVGGLIALVFGSRSVVTGAVAIALRLRVPSIILGLTIVSIGTSLPELAVSVDSSLSGEADLAVGNAVGSNVFNILVILGAASVLAPLRVNPSLVRMEVPLFLGSCLLLLAICLDGGLGRFEGLLFLLLYAAYTWFLVRKAQHMPTLPDPKKLPRSWFHAALLMILGLAGLVVGAELMVGGALAVAQSLGVSPLVTGLTIVAIGTSLPEASVSIAAAARGEADLAVGNAVGSSIFNILGVLGTVGALSAATVPISRGVLTFDFVVMTGVAIAMVPVFWTDARMDRLEGLLFLLYYAVYMFVLWLDAAEHPAHELWEAGAVMFFALSAAASILAFWARRRATADKGATSGERPR